MVGLNVIGLLQTSLIIYTPQRHIEITCSNRRRKQWQRKQKPAAHTANCSLRVNRTIHIEEQKRKELVTANRRLLIRIVARFQIGVGSHHQVFGFVATTAAADVVDHSADCGAVTGP